ncbi:MAG: AAA family ATPase [Halodesulfurarchaeum sp.]
MTDSSETEPVAGSTRRYDAAAEARPLSTGEASDLAHAIIENVETVIVGKRERAEHMLTTVLGRGHLLLEDVPGVGKTMLARATARSIAGEFRRVQFTPDLLPTDVTGVNVFNEKSREFEFRPGPIFANVVLADEINRAPPKTQSALLEAMEEEQVTVDGDTRRLPDPFIVIATQNTVDRDRTYDLPVAELDRFMKRVTIGYPTQQEEVAVLDRIVGGHPIEAVEPVTSVEEVRRARATAAEVEVATEVGEYVTRLTRYTRDHAELGASPRASIDLLRASQGRAVLEGREYVIPDDVKTEAVPVLGHRIRAEPGGTVGGEPGRTVVERALETVPPE